MIFYSGVYRIVLKNVIAIDESMVSKLCNLFMVTAIDEN